jgi:hypothetical protein
MYGFDGDSQSECNCNQGWVCEEHPDFGSPYPGCDWGVEILCPNPECTKDPASLLDEFVSSCPGGRAKQLKPAVRKDSRELKRTAKQRRKNYGNC